MSKKGFDYEIITILKHADDPEFFQTAITNAINIQFGEIGYDRFDSRTFLNHLIDHELFSSFDNVFNKRNPDFHEELGQAGDILGGNLQWFQRMYLNFDNTNEDHIELKDILSEFLDNLGFRHPLKTRNSFKSFAESDPETIYKVAYDCMGVLRGLNQIVLCLILFGKRNPSINVRPVGLDFKLQVFETAPVVFCKYCHRPCDSSNITCKEHRSANQAEYKARVRKVKEKVSIFSNLDKGGELVMSLSQDIFRENQDWLRENIDRHLPELSKVAKTIAANNMADFLSQLFTKIDAFSFLENERGQDEGYNFNLIKSLLIYESWEQALANSKGPGRPAKFQREDVIRMRNKGYKMFEIADKFGVSSAAVSKKLKL